MALVRWQNSENELPVFSSFFNDIFDSDFGNFFANTNMQRIPAVNIRETNEDFRVELAAPGLKKEDFKVNLENNMLTIEGGKEEEKLNENERFTRREFSYDSFQRTFTLPNIVEQDRIDASYQNGILHVVIPKKQEARIRNRQISIR